MAFGGPPTCVESQFWADVNEIKWLWDDQERLEGASYDRTNERLRAMRTGDQIKRVVKNWKQEGVWRDTWGSGQHTEGNCRVQIKFNALRGAKWAHEDEDSNAKDTRDPTNLSERLKHIGRIEASRPRHRLQSAIRREEKRLRHERACIVRARKATLNKQAFRNVARYWNPQPPCRRISDNLINFWVDVENLPDGVGHPFKGSVPMGSGGALCGHRCRNYS